MPNGSKIVAGLYDTLQVPNIKWNILTKFGDVGIKDIGFRRKIV
jgi:hypothetical protein